MAKYRAWKLYTERAEIALGARLNPIANRRSGLRVLFFALLALCLELRVLLGGQDRFCLFHVFRFAGFRATGLLMVRHGRVHLCLLFGCQIKTRQ